MTIKKLISAAAQSGGGVNMTLQPLLPAHCLLSMPGSVESTD